MCMQWRPGTARGGGNCTPLNFSIENFFLFSLEICLKKYKAGACNYAYLGKFRNKIKFEQPPLSPPSENCSFLLPIATERASPAIWLNIECQFGIKYVERAVIVVLTSGTVESDRTTVLNLVTRTGTKVLDYIITPNQRLSTRRSVWW